MKAQINTIRSITTRRSKIDVNLYELRIGYDNDKLEGKNREVRLVITRTSGHGRPQWFYQVVELINTGKYEEALKVKYLTKEEKEDLQKLLTN